MAGIYTEHTFPHHFTYKLVIESSENLPPFDKEYMAAQIRRGSGNVLEKYSEAEIILAEQGTSSSVTKTPQKTKKKSGSPSSTTTLLLISNTHCRTAKYIQCLASGIPIVSFQWVINSCKQVGGWSTTVKSLRLYLLFLVWYFY